MHFFKKTRYRIGENRFYLLASVIAIVLIYLPSLRAPWYFDDFTSIVYNPAIRDLGDSFLNILGPRGLALFSFSLNYHFGGLNVFGYHVTNIVIHYFCSFFVFLILKRFYRRSSFLVFLGAFIFLLHPIQTQSVTYIVQRMASLCVLFFLGSVFVFLKHIEVDDKVVFKKYFYLLLSVLLGFLAAFSKENAFLLPFVILSVAFFVDRDLFFSRKFSFVLFSYFLISFYLVFQQLFFLDSTSNKLSVVPFFLSPDTGQFLNRVLYDPENLRLRYLFTQFEVFWIYALKVYCPTNLALDYCYPLVERFLNFRTLLSGVGIVAVFSFAVYSLRKIPLLCFGIVWIFITLSLESSFFPLDPIFEHRLYLPMVGYILVFLEVLRKLFSNRNFWTMGMVVLFALSFLTWERNRLWASPLKFWESNHLTVPSAPRPVYWLAMEYLAAKRYDDVLALMEKDPDHFESHLGMTRVRGEAYFGMGEEAKAFEVFSRARRRFPYDNSLEFFQGMSRFNAANYAEASRLFDRARSIDRSDVRAGYYLACSLYLAGDHYGSAAAANDLLTKDFYTHSHVDRKRLEYRGLARSLYEKALAALEPVLSQKRQQIESDPGNLNLVAEFALMLQGIGLYHEAIEHYDVLDRVASPRWQVPYNLALIYERLHDSAKARAYFEKSLALNPSNAMVLTNLGGLLRKAGEQRAALELFRRALEADPAYGEALLGLAGVYVALRNKEKAREALSVLSNQFPGFAPQAKRLFENL